MLSCKCLRYFKLNGLADHKSSDEAQGALEDFQNKTKLSQKGRFQGVLERLLRLRQT